MIPVVTAAQMREVEAAELARGATEDELTDRASSAILDRLIELLPIGAGARVVVVAGPGNNGMDALKVHRLLEASGVGSSLHCWNRPDCPPLSSGALEEDLRGAAVALDGLFGIGLARGVEGEPAAVVELLNSERARRQKSAAPVTVVSVDIPSGLLADTGEAPGAAVEADITVTLGLPKVGLLTGKGPELSGRILREPIGLPAPEGFEGVASGFDARTPHGLPSRRVGSHKNDNGRVLVLGGSLRYPGAPVLSALAAHRAGAGYVTVGFPRSMLGVIASRLLEETLLPLPEAEPGTLGPPAIEEAMEGAEGYKALVLGNGLHREDPTVEFVLGLLGVPAAVRERRVGFRAPAAEGPIPAGFGGRRRRVVGFAVADGEDDSGTPAQLPPTVVDGDGLYALSTQEGWWEHTPSVALLTPHPGEMARLTGREVSDVEADRLGTAREAARRWGKTVLLKGSYPVVASPDGAPEVLVESHPELGTAGTGDVLAGVAGYALSLGLAPAAAARAALILGSRAAAAASRGVGPDAVGAGDLIEALAGARRGSGG